MIKIAFTGTGYISRIHAPAISHPPPALRFLFTPKIDVDILPAAM
jgi:hypothetical protein